MKVGSCEGLGGFMATGGHDKEVANLQARKGPITRTCTLMLDFLPPEL